MDIRSLEKYIEKQNYEKIREFICKLDAKDFPYIRQSKIFFKISCVKKLLKLSELFIRNISYIDSYTVANIKNYFDFVIIVHLIEEEILEGISVASEELSKQDIYTCISNICDDYYKIHPQKDINIDLTSDDLSSIDTLNSHMKSTSKKIHELLGRKIDELHCLSRAIYHITRIDFQEELVEYTPTMNKIILAYSEMEENLNYLIDKVSFGELDVVKLDSEQGIVDLTANNLEQIKARRLNLRNGIMQRIISKGKIENHWKVLHEIGMDFLFSIANVYEKEFKIKFSKEKLKESIDYIICDFNYIDDLLIIAGEDENIFMYYIIGIFLQSVSVIIEHLKEYKLNKWYDKNLFYISTTTLEKFLKINYNFSDSDILKGINFFVSNIPLNYEHELFDKPFLMINNELFGVLTLTSAFTFNASIHFGFLKGGKVGKKFGELLEIYIADLFSSYSWRVLGKRIDIKNGREKITDIDVAVEKDGVLLLIESKALMYQFGSPYTYNVSREKLQRAASQIEKGRSHLNCENESIQNLLKKNKINPQDIKYVLPIIVTPPIIFTGWKISDVPVISIDYLIMVLNGGKSNIVDLDGNIIREQSFFYESSEGDNYKRLLENPYYWEIDSIGLNRRVTEVQLMGYTFRYDEYS